MASAKRRRGANLKWSKCGACVLNVISLDASCRRGFFGANGKAKKVEKGEEEEELPRKRQRLETENEGSSQSTAVEDDTSAGIEAKEEEEEHIVQSDSEASPETEDDTPGEEEALPADTSATDLGDTP